MSGWPDANNDRGAPMRGTDWAFVVAIAWAVIATAVLVIERL